MKLSADMFLRLSGVVLISAPLVAACAPQTKSAKDVELPMENIRLPVQLYPDGSLKTEIRAAQASMPQPNGDVVGRNVMVMLYKPGGKTLEGRIWAESCRFNHSKGTADSEGRVRLEREGVCITGQGFDWNAKEEVVRIHNDVRVEMDRSKVRKEWKHGPTIRR